MDLSEWFKTFEIANQVSSLPRVVTFQLVYPAQQLGIPVCELSCSSLLHQLFIVSVDLSSTGNSSSQKEMACCFKGEEKKSKVNKGMTIYSLNNLSGNRNKLYII